MKVEGRTYKAGRQGERKVKKGGMQGERRVGRERGGLQGEREMEGVEASWEKV